MDDLKKLCRVGLNQYMDGDWEFQDWEVDEKSQKKALENPFDVAAMGEQQTI